MRSVELVTADEKLRESERKRELGGERRWWQHAEVVIPQFCAIKIREFHA